MTAELQSYVIALRATANPQDCVMIGKAEVTCSPKLSSQRCQKEIYLSSSQKREREREHTLPLWGNIFGDAFTMDPLAVAAVMVAWPLATSMKKVADLGCFSQFGIILGHVATFHSISKAL